MVRQMVGRSGVARGGWAGLLTAVVVLALAGAALAAGTVTFDGSPATNPPPKRLDGLKMTKFAPDRRARGSRVTTINGPTGLIKLSRAVVYNQVRTHKSGYWQTWSNHYRGDVYEVNPSTTLTLPARTTAFYFYAEPNDSTARHPTFAITASTSGATSGPVQVHGFAGAMFFGFVATGGRQLKSITVRSNDQTIPGKKKGTFSQFGGFAIGEFGIHRG